MIAALALVGCEKASPGPKIPPGLSIHLTRMPPRVGDQIVVGMTMSMEMSFDVKGTPVEAKQMANDEVLQEVLAVDGFAPSRIRVTYKTMSDTSEMMGRPEATRDPRAGKTYIVFREEGRLRATYEDGSTPPRGELKKVLENNKGVGVEDEWEAIVAGRTWKSGERYTFTADELTRVNEAKRRASTGNPRDTERWTRCQLMLRSVDNGVAIFSLVMGVRLEDDDSAMEFVVDGDARIEQATGRLLETSGTGAITGTTQRIPFKGSIRMREQKRWIAAPRYPSAEPRHAG